MAEKIIFDTSGDTPRAIAAELSSSSSPDAPRYRVRATREITLSAGAVGSPQILMLSGIGPAHELQQLDIPVVSNLPAVGQNLSDVST